MNDEPLETEISEESLLCAEAEDARAALQAALLEVKDSLLRTTDPKLWARTHPWVSVSVAAAAGFAAAAAIVPEPGQRIADKWVGMVHRFSPHHQGVASDLQSSASAASAPNTSPSIWASLIDALFELAKVAITNLLASMAQVKTATTTADADDVSEASSPEATAKIDGVPPQHVV